MRRSRLFVYILIFSVLLLIPFLPGVIGSKDGISMDRPIASTLFVPYEPKQLLVFFGYVGCSDVCTPRLSEMAAVYDAIPPKKRAGVAVLFINVKPLHDKTLADIFAKSFHPDFFGISPSRKELSDAVKQFNVYYGDSLLEPGEIDHTAFLFLLQKKKSGYHLRKIFTQVPFESETIIKSLE